VNSAACFVFLFVYTCVIGSAVMSSAFGQFSPSHHCWRACA